MTVSMINVDVIQEWLGISDDEVTAIQAQACLTAAISRVCGYTGLTLSELDEHEDIAIAVLGIVNDFYTNNRPDTAQISINKMSKSILDMYSKNLL